MPMDQAASLGDIFLTVTGDINVIVEKHFLKMKTVQFVRTPVISTWRSTKRLGPHLCVSCGSQKNIEGYLLPNGNTVYLMAEGRLVNLAAGDGHPAEIMDLSFAMQALAASYLCEMRENWNRICISCRESSIRRSQRSNCIPWDMRSTC